MNNKYLIKENIENLISLWQLVSEPFKGYHTNEAFTCYDVRDSQWPTRLWFHEIINKSDLKKADTVYFSKSEAKNLSYFDIHKDAPTKLLNDFNFKIRYVQRGMVLKIGNSYNYEERLTLKHVITKDDAILWSALFFQSFNYKVHPNQVLLPLEKTFFYIVSDKEGHAIGTIIAHNTNSEVIGIHSMGIIPKERQKGYATELMQIVINQAKLTGFSHVTLQASEKAVSLYEKLGFEKQFLIKNYHKTYKHSNI